jgi:predicted nucleotidyltransferase
MGIADFLISRRQQRLLAPLLTQPHRSFSSSELLRLSGAGRGAGQLQLQKLLSAGVVLDERVGNQRRIRVNVAFPLYLDLRSICLKSFGLAERLRAALKPLGKRIQQAFVFGSIAKNTDRHDSDIDLMVVGTVTLIKLNELLAPLEAELGRKIHVNLYAPREWEKSKRDKVVAAVLAEPILRIIPDGNPVG